MNGMTVAVSPPDGFFRATIAQRQVALAEIADAGLDGILYADHVSFRGGSGADGLILMAGLSQLHPTLTLQMGVYLLPLRHPVTVARQLSTLAELAPGRLVFGVGIGGEDRHEIEVCGVDPRTRGRRCDESLEVLRALLSGEAVTHHGEFFDLENCRVLPAPSPPPPVLVGGRSDAAISRAARLGDGWVASWCSARRFAEATERCESVAHEAGRSVAWRHQLQLWVGFGPSRDVARASVAKGMERFYQLPFEGFERYTPYGSPADVAAFFEPYVAAGLRHLSLTPCAGSPEEAIAGAAEVKRLLSASL